MKKFFVLIMITISLQSSENRHLMSFSGSKKGVKMEEISSIVETLEQENRNLQRVLEMLEKKKPQKVIKEIKIKYDQTLKKLESYGIRSFPHWTSKVTGANTVSQLLQNVEARDAEKHMFVEGLNNAFRFQNKMHKYGYDLQSCQYSAFKIMLNMINELSEVITKTEDKEWENASDIGYNMLKLFATKDTNDCTPLQLAQKGGFLIGDALLLEKSYEHVRSLVSVYSANNSHYKKVSDMSSYIKEAQLDPSMIFYENARGRGQETIFEYAINEGNSDLVQSCLEHANHHFPKVNLNLCVSQNFFFYEPLLNFLPCEPRSEGVDNLFRATGLDKNMAYKTLLCLLKNKQLSSVNMFNACIDRVFTGCYYSRKNSKKLFKQNEYDCNKTMMQFCKKEYLHTPTDEIPNYIEVKWRDYFESDFEHYKWAIKNDNYNNVNRNIATNLEQIMVTTINEKERFLLFARDMQINRFNCAFQNISWNINQIKEAKKIFLKCVQQDTALPDEEKLCMAELINEKIMTESSDIKKYEKSKHSKELAKFIRSLHFTVSLSDKEALLKKVKYYVYEKYAWFYDAESAKNFKNKLIQEINELFDAKAERA